ncbi:CDP-alcohol phosphatidyltransferase family protein [Simkania negevensis]|uniref:CDP-alcohol phosphatidyltransferase family protein n=1 Tax=Simkania negevensis TaxID=83561 RepID=A0ABS3AR79_9BACT|nr:CDP-alcohol phosphatidyltransferase family protein [Simkania negevensis]
MKKISLLPNAITTFALACGLFVILRVNVSVQGCSYYDVLHSSAILLLIAALADTLDGAVARLVRAESEFGFNFDSLADTVNFGVAPSVLMLKSLVLAPDSFLFFFAMASAMLYSICGVLRLVRFNVKSKQVDRDTMLTFAQKKNFTGLPIPAAAAAVVSVNLFSFSDDCAKIVSINDAVRSSVLAVIMVVIAYFMVSRWKFPSLKTLQFRIPSFPLVVAIVLVALLLLYGILYHFALVFFGISWLYLVIGWILSIIRLVVGKKSKTLIDFEPEPESDEEDHHL